MSKQERLDQQLMLEEFLKYAKMAEHMFHVTQGSNFDTANFNDPYLVFKKFEQLKKAQTSIISDVDELLANSFVGKLGKTVKDVRNALATILKSDSKKVRDIIEQVLLPYINMNDRDFTKLAQKAVNDLFDYAVQTTQGLNKDVFRVLIEKGGVATQLDKFMKSIANDPLHPLYGNHIVGKDGILKVQPSSRTGENAVNNVKVRGLENKVYNQNLIIWAFRDIKEYLKDKPKLYDSIVELAILQSGLSSSAISFTSVVPYEDFERYYHSTLMKLDSIANLSRFAELGVFQRNNWNNDEIVPQGKAAWVPTVKGKKYNPAMAFINPMRVQNAVRKGTIPPVMNVRLGTKESNFDRIVYSWEKYEELLPANWQKLYPKMKSFDAIKAIKAEMRAKGDYSYINKSLFERVVDSYGTPLETEYKNKRGEVVKQHVYKAINAWGDAQRANEFYDVEKKSIIDNGMLKVEGIDNSKIIELFTGKKTIEEKTEEVVENPQYKEMPQFNSLPGKSTTPTMTYAGIGSRQTPSNILSQMTEVAKELESKGYILNTGKTFGNREEGADYAFSKGTKKKNLFSPEEQGSRVKEQSIAKEIHPNPSALSPAALKLMARNTNQVFGDKLDTPVDFILFYAKETKTIRPEGGTGQAVEMARRKGIPTINMADANWRSQLDDILNNREETEEDWRVEDNTCPVPF